MRQLSLAKFQNEVNEILAKNDKRPVTIGCDQTSITITCEDGDDFNIWLTGKGKLSRAYPGNYRLMHGVLEIAKERWVISPALSCFTKTPLDLMERCDITFATKREAGMSEWRRFIGKPNLTPPERWIADAIRLEWPRGRSPVLTPDLADALGMFIVDLHCPGDNGSDYYVSVNRLSGNKQRALLR